MKELFVLIVILWGIFGLIGITHNYSYNPRVNWGMILFLLTVPFLPLFAKMCGLM